MKLHLSNLALDCSLQLIRGLPQLEQLSISQRALRDQLLLKGFHPQLHGRCLVQIVTSEMN